MLRIAREIVCINMGIAYRAVPLPAAAIATMPSLFRRWQSGGSSGATGQDIQQSMDKVNRET